MSGASQPAETPVKEGGGGGAHRSHSITSMGKSIGKSVVKGLGKSTQVRRNQDSAGASHVCTVQHC
jgi:hypothetical protein